VKLSLHFWTRLKVTNNGYFVGHWYSFDPIVGIYTRLKSIFKFQIYL